MKKDGKQQERQKMATKNSQQAHIKISDNECPDPAECRADRICASNKFNHFPLCSVRPGQTVKIVRAAGGRRLAAKLANMGLYPGSELRVLSNLMGPMIIEVKGSRLSLGRGVASKIMVRE